MAQFFERINKDIIALLAEEIAILAEDEVKHISKL